MNRRSSVLLLTIWCLLSAWLLFGCLELGEELKLLVKAQTCAQDLDMEALLQLASGLKPDVPTVGNGPEVSVAAETVQSPCLLSTHTRCWEHPRAVQVFPSLRLHQHLSVYRI